MIGKHLGLLRDLAALLGIRGLAIAASLGLAVLLARTLGPEGFGLYTLIMTIYLVLQPLAGGGLATLVMRDTARVEGSLKGDHAGHALGLVLFVGTSVATLVGIAAHVLGYPNAILFLWAIPLLPLAMTVEVAGGFLSGQHRVKQSQFICLTLRPVAVLLACLVLITLTGTLGVAFALISSAIGAGICTLLALRASPVSVPWHSISQGLMLRSARLLWMAIPFGLITAAQYLATRLDILFIGILLDETDVGYYQVGARLAQFVTVPGGLLVALLQPRIAAAFARGDVGRHTKLSWGGSLGGLLLGCSAAAVLFVLGDVLILGVFGQAFAESLTPFHILLIAQGIFAGQGIAFASLVVSDRQRLGLWATSLSLMLNAAANAILIPLHGLAGAAWATVFSGSIVMAFIFLCLYRLTADVRRSVGSPS